MYRMTNSSKKTPKNATSYDCIKCSFKCGKISDYNRHINTAKHKRMTNNDANAQKTAILHICECGKKYKFRQGLYSHKQKCNVGETKNATIVSTEDDKNGNPDNNKESLILTLITQNKELMNMLVNKQEETMELLTQNKEMQQTIKEIIPKIGNNNTTNTTNNKFNLQVFLNEDCKDAINFSEFLESIQVTVEDLENQAQLGYVGGISNLFLENMKELGVNKRPLHCTDKKRNTLYIKENNEWDKEGSQDQLLHGIKIVTGRAHQTLCDMKEENSEEYSDMDSDFSNKCINIQRNLLPGFPRESTFGKVIDSISNGSVVDKE